MTADLKFMESPGLFPFRGQVFEVSESLLFSSCKTDRKLMAYFGSDNHRMILARDASLEVRVAVSKVCDDKLRFRLLGSSLRGSTSPIFTRPNSIDTPHGALLSCLFSGIESKDPVRVACCSDMILRRSYIKDHYPLAFSKAIMNKRKIELCSQGKETPPSKLFSYGL